MVVNSELAGPGSEGWFMGFIYGSRLLSIFEKRDDLPNKTSPPLWWWVLFMDRDYCRLTKSVTIYPIKHPPRYGGGFYLWIVTIYPIKHPLSYGRRFYLWIVPAG